MREPRSQSFLPTVVLAVAGTIVLGILDLRAGLAGASSMELLFAWPVFAVAGGLAVRLRRPLTGAMLFAVAPVCALLRTQTGRSGAELYVAIAILVSALITGRFLEGERSASA
jgi:hypothetical protein